MMSLCSFVAACIALNLTRAGGDGWTSCLVFLLRTGLSGHSQDPVPWLLLISCKLKQRSLSLGAGWQLLATSSPPPPTLLLNLMCNCVPLSFYKELVLLSPVWSFSKELTSYHWQFCLHMWKEGRSPPPHPSPHVRQHLGQKRKRVCFSLLRTLKTAFAPPLVTAMAKLVSSIFQHLFRGGGGCVFILFCNN